MKKENMEPYFWIKLLSDLLNEDMSESKLTESLKQICKKKVTFPDGTWKTPDLRTLTRKYHALKKHGHEGLKRKKRSDVGKNRTISDAIIKRIIELKIEDPLRGGAVINDLVEMEYGKRLPKSTLYRHLKLAGATRIKLGVSKKKVRKRWTKAFSNELWIGDFSDGPKVLNEKNEKLRTFLSAFIDCHSRFVVSARYYYTQKLDILADTMIKGWVINGLPDAIYVDNAKVYHSDKFTTACLNNYVKVKYRPVRDPAAGGLIERFFQTVQLQFENEIKKKDNLTLNDLNSLFTIWLHEHYHKRVHAALKNTPENIFNLDLRNKRSITMHKASESFLFEAQRKVDKDFSDISLNSCYYKIDKRYRTDTLLVKYYPFEAHPEEIYIFSLDGIYLCTAKKHNRESGELVQKNNTVKYTDGNHPYIKLLEQKITENILKAGINQVSYISIPEKEISLNAFMNMLANICGIKAGISAFTKQEVRQIKDCYMHINPVKDINIIKQSFENNDSRNLNIILQKIINLKMEEKQ
jgi:transposase InsO family protein